MYIHTCVYDSCRVQGFRSLLVAITVARRAKIIALIVSRACARAQGLGRSRDLDTRVTRVVKDNFCERSGEWNGPRKCCTGPSGPCVRRLAIGEREIVQVVVYATGRAFSWCGTPLNVLVSFLIWAFDQWMLTTACRILSVLLIVKVFLCGPFFNSCVWRWRFSMKGFGMCGVCWPLFYFISRGISNWGDEWKIVFRWIESWLYILEVIICIETDICMYEFLFW